MPHKPSTFVLSIGATHVTLRRVNGHTVRTAKILGQEVRDKTRTLWLDRLVLDPITEEIEGDMWEASGAVSTILYGPVEAEAA